MTIRYNRLGASALLLMMAISTTVAIAAAIEGDLRGPGVRVLQQTGDSVRVAVAWGPPRVVRQDSVIGYTLRIVSTQGIKLKDVPGLVDTLWVARDTITQIVGFAVRARSRSGRQWEFSPATPLLVEAKPFVSAPGAPTVVPVPDSASMWPELDGDSIEVGQSIQVTFIMWFKDVPTFCPQGAGGWVPADRRADGTVVPAGGSVVLPDESCDDVPEPPGLPPSSLRHYLKRSV